MKKIFFHINKERHGIIMRLEKMYPDILDEARKKNIPVFIPVGVMEYHCNHLPLGTDTQTPLYLLERLEQERDIIIAPPVWYGCASYAVKGPEGYSIDMDGEVLNKMMYNIYLSMLRSGFRRVITVLYHQTEDFNPTETACLDASRRAIFKYLEEKRGIGWWGENKTHEAYEAEDNANNPWDWLRVMPLLPREFEADHAGYQETSMLWALRPELIRPEKFAEAKDWFAETAKNASMEAGEEMVQYALNFWRNYLG